MEKPTKINFRKKSVGNKLYFILLFGLTIFLIGACKNNNPADDFEKLDILTKIQTLEGVTVTEIEPKNGYPRAFQIDITQPIDHNNPNGAKFSQRVYLSHIDENSPMVFAPNGYRAGPSSNQEIAGVLQANCLNVTHRYFYDSRPNPLDWQYLTIKQSADDHHQIVSLFKKIYKGKWISSGASKSGLATLFHRRYYPEDVNATIAYVAPFTFGVKDQRFPEYLNNIGSSECFQKLIQIQQYALKHKSEILPLIDNYILSGNLAYSLDRELLMELNIMDYPFTFWQYYNLDCSSIPDTTTSSTAEIFSHYSGIVPITSFSDENLAYYEPYTYQAVSEMGAPAYQTDYLSDLLNKVDPNSVGNPNYELLAPAGQSYSFNSNTMIDIYQWLQAHGDKIIYIYGKNDPWSAGAIELNGSVDAVFIMQQGTNHQVKIAQLDDPKMVYNALERWLGIQINAGNNKLLMADEDKQGFRLGE